MSIVRLANDVPEPNISITLVDPCSKSIQPMIGSASETHVVTSKSDGGLSFFSGSNASTTLGGKASLQPKRTSVTNEEIEAVLDLLLVYQ
ncbi:hypothetical protein QL285_034446 [Trifolium repens]|nr:hypothetical protein QL285_034446 [Trifolium repens]